MLAIPEWFYRLKICTLIVAVVVNDSDTAVKLVLYISNLSSSMSLDHL